MNKVLNKKDILEALTFFGLTEDYTYISLRNSYIKFLEDYQNTHDLKSIKKEELDKSSNYYYLLASKFNKETYEEKSRLAILKFDFKKELETLKKMHSYSEIISLCDKTLEKIANLSLEEFVNLRGEFNRTFNETLENIKTSLLERERERRMALDDNKENKEISNIKEIKKELKEYFFKLFTNNTLNLNNEDREEYKEFLLDLNFLIDGLKDNEINTNYSILKNIKFEDLDYDKKVLENLPIQVYINRQNGEVVILKRKEDDETLYYQIEDKKVISSETLEFEKNFISLKNFLRTAEYIANKDIRLIDNKNVIYLKTGNIDAIYGTKDTILVAYKEDNSYEFVFYTKEMFTDNEASFKVFGNLEKEVDNKFQDKDLTYQILSNYYKEKNKLSEEKGKGQI